MMKTDSHILRAMVSSVALMLIVTTIVHRPRQAFAQSADAVKIPETEAGRRVAAYIKAFNSGEDVMRDFLSNNVSPSGLAQRPVEARLSIYRQMRGNMEAIEPRRLISASESNITILFHTKAGDWMQIGFIFEDQPPHYLSALRVEDGESPSRSEAEAGGQPVKPLASEAELVPALEKHLDELTRADKFSGVVLLAKDGNIVFHKAYGLANKSLNVANRLDTKFNIGSINKTFTEVAIGQLVEQGKLSVEDTIGKILPDYPNRQAAEKVTVKQLLNMSSGIGDFFGEKYMATPKDKIRSIKDFFQFFAAEPLLFEPGTNRRYSNGGYIVLGAIIEKVSGSSYYDYVREHITKPLAMTNTDSYEVDLPAPNTASGYTKRMGDGPNGERRLNIYSLPARPSSAGGGYSTTEDLFKFTNALVSGKLIKRGTMTRVFSNDGPDSGSNRAGSAPQVPLSMGFAGGSPGVNADVEVEDNYTLVVLSNYDPPSAEEIGKQVRKWVRGLKK